MNKSSGDVTLNITPNVTEDFEVMFATPKLNSTKYITFRNKKLNKVNDGFYNGGVKQSKLATPKNAFQPTDPEFIKKSRRSFTPSKLNQNFVFPDFSPIEINKSLNRSAVLNNSKNNASILGMEDLNNAFCSITLNDLSQISSSPSFMDLYENPSVSFLPPRKKTVLRRITSPIVAGIDNKENIDLNNLDKSINLSSKSLKFSSTPSIKKDKNNSEIGNSSTDNSNSASDSFYNVSNVSLTPKTCLEKCITIPSILIGMDMRHYIKNFEKYNLQIEDFMELNNNDLIMIGIKNEKDRKEILKIINSEQDST